MASLLKKVPWWIQLLIVSAVALAVGYFVGYDIGYEKSQRNNINSFEECAAAGYPIQQSFPEVCRTPSGKSFTST